MRPQCGAGPGAVLLLSLGLLLPTTAPAARLPAAPSSGGLAAAAVAWPFDPVTGEELPWPPKALLAVAEGQNVFFGSTEAAETFKADPKAFFLDGKSAPLADHPQGLPDMQGRSVNCPNGCGEIEVTASRPRIQLKHGQNIYISCFNCLNTILERPDRYFGNITAWQEEDQPRGDCLAEPPLGPTDEAFCPVTGQKLKISAGTVAVQFRGPGGFTGQKIFVASEDAAAALKAHMAEFFLQGADLPLAEYHGGLPEMRNHTVWDPCGGGSRWTSTRPAFSSATGRCEARWGPESTDERLTRNLQNLYAADYGCINVFWGAMVPSGTRTERGSFLA